MPNSAQTLMQSCEYEIKLIWDVVERCHISGMKSAERLAHRVLTALTFVIMQYPDPRRNNDPGPTHPITVAAYILDVVAAARFAGLTIPLTLEAQCAIVGMGHDIIEDLTLPRNNAGAEELKGSAPVCVNLKGLRAAFGALATRRIDDLSKTVYDPNSGKMIKRDPEAVWSAIRRDPVNWVTKLCDRRHNIQTLIDKNGHFVPQKKPIHGKINESLLELVLPCPPSSFGVRERWMVAYAQHQLFLDLVDVVEKAGIEYDFSQADARGFTIDVSPAFFAAMQIDCGACLEGDHTLPFRGRKAKTPCAA